MIKANTFHTQPMTPAIICTADFSGYLIGAEDANGSFHNIYGQQSNKPFIVPTLEQAKHKLKDLGVSQVIIKLNTPYDEMIGQSSYGSTRMLVSL